MSIGQALRRPAAPFRPVPALLGLVLVIMGLLWMHTLAGSHDANAGASVAGPSVSAPADGADHHHPGPADHTHAPSTAAPDPAADTECLGTCCGDMPGTSECELAAGQGSLSWLFVPALLTLTGGLGLRGPPPVPEYRTHFPPSPSPLELSISRT